MTDATSSGNVFNIDYAYGQIHLHDRQSMDVPGFREGHVAQGFARKESHVVLFTLLEYGDAVVRTHQGGCVEAASGGQCVEVPFLCTSGTVEIGGPEEHPPPIAMPLVPGAYLVTFAQRVEDDDVLMVDVWFQPTATLRAYSRVLWCEGSPPDELVETAPDL